MGVCVSVFVYVSVFVCDCLTLCLCLFSVFLSVYMRVYLCLTLAVFLSACISVLPYVALGIVRIIPSLFQVASCLQCFDTVGWAAGRASGP